MNALVNNLKQGLSQLQNTHPQQESDALLSLIQQLVWLIEELQQDVKELKEKNT